MYILINISELKHAFFVFAAYGTKYRNFDGTIENAPWRALRAHYEVITVAAARA